MLRDNGILGIDTDSVLPRFIVDPIMSRRQGILVIKFIMIADFSSYLPHTAPRGEACH